MRRLVTIALTVIASVTFTAHPVFADDNEGGGANNVVQVNNHSDGKLKTKTRADVAHDGGPTVANENLALARASCVDCRTVAVAVQVVLMEATVSDFRPANAAVAVNDNCVRCQTFAFARQELLTADRPVRISDEGAEQVATIEGQIRQVADSSEAFDQMAADLDSLTDQLVTVLQREIDRAGSASRHDSKRQVDEREE